MRFTSDAELVLAVLGEDRAFEDLTCASLKTAAGSRIIPADMPFSILAKADGIFSGANWFGAFEEIFELKDAKIFSEGREFKRGERVVVARGDPFKILSFERTLLNGLQQFCGVAGLTRQAVDLVRARWNELGQAGEPPLVLHTRKTLPLLRKFQVEAVVAGGGKRHRENLSDRILVKENHKDLCKTLGLSFSDYVGSLPAGAQVEVESATEALLVAAAGVRDILLDNFPPAQVLELLPRLPAGVVVEVSGGLNLENLASFVIPGVRRLSLGALTHSVRAVDLSLDLEFRHAC